MFRQIVYYCSGNDPDKPARATKTPVATVTEKESREVQPIADFFYAKPLEYELSHSIH